jgi:hypothetical protein
MSDGTHDPNGSLGVWVYFWCRFRECVRTENHAVTATTPRATDVAPGILRRVRTHVVARCSTWACWWGGITGVAPHVLHHAGPLAGTALLSGAGGTSLFGVLGFVATTPCCGACAAARGFGVPPGWRWRSSPPSSRCRR